MRKNLIMFLRDRQEVSILGTLPVGWSSPTVAGGIRSKLVTPEQPLEFQLDKTPPRVIASVIGIGDPERLLRLSSEQDELQADWWRCSGHAVHVFAYSCFSHEFFQSSGASQYVATGLVYEGKIWYDPEGCKFWPSLVGKIYSIVRSAGFVDPNVVARVIRCYTDLLDGGLFGMFRKTGHLRKLCLLQQIASLRYLEGGAL